MKQRKILTIALGMLLCGASLAANGDGNGTVTKRKTGGTATLPAMPRMDYRPTPGRLPLTANPMNAPRRAAANGLTADFSIQDGTSQVTVWSDNFDSTDRDVKGNLKFDGWTFNHGDGDVVTFTKEEAGFSAIDPDDVYSMHIDGPYQVFKRTKAWAESAAIEVPANAQLHAFVKMSKMWNEYVTLAIQVSTDGFETMTEVWKSTEVEESGTHWVQVDADLSGFAGQSVNLRLYWGPGTNDTFNTGGYMGDFYVDGLSVTGVETVESVHVLTGDVIQFADMSTGSPTRWQWTFPGGTPSESTDRHPQVYYERPGTYDVSLTVYDDEGEDALTRTAFVTVEGQLPVAGVEWPADFRDLNTRMRMVAPFAAAHYADASQGFPTDFSWTMYTPWDVANGGLFFQPDTVYTTRDVDYRHDRLGQCYVLHIAQNEMGYDFVDDSVQVQFAGLVTNFRPDDGYQTNFVDGDLTLPGANKMGITAWAERFSKPSAPVVLEGMYVNFTKAEASELYDQIQSVNFSLYSSVDGLPGQPLQLLDSWTMSELNYAMTTNGGTVTVELSAPIVITDEVFVVIDGIPEKNDDMECAIAMAPMRSEGNTAFMLNKGTWRPFTGYFQAAPGGQTSLSVFPYYTYSVVVPALVDEEMRVTVGADSTVVAQKAGEAEILVFANRGITAYGSVDADWCRLTGAPGEYTVDTLHVAYDELPEGIDRRETIITVTDGITTLPLRIIQQRVPDDGPIVPTGINNIEHSTLNIDPSSPSMFNGQSSMSNGLFDLQGRALSMPASGKLPPGTYIMPVQGIRRKVVVR